MTSLLYAATSDVKVTHAVRAPKPGHVRPGQRILNSANDGSTILYTEYGLPVVNLATLGSATAPYTYQLLGGFRDYPTDPTVRRDLLDLHVDWLYVDDQAPAIGVGGAPFAWPQADRLTVPRGFEGGADELVTRVAGGSSDDRGLVLIWRSA